MEKISMDKLNKLNQTDLLELTKDLLIAFENSMERTNDRQAMSEYFVIKELMYIL